ncbi:DUF4157 domain-containing protein [Streptomyces misionensis]|uniref:eCIS core domain-containing protein n=1 Tax=Streptomyces misionensis TaxID=67331 RepID=UPI0021BDD0F0|nr:DUF4157 domain-containing protein [Streptomyces misionensis]
MHARHEPEGKDSRESAGRAARPAGGARAAEPAVPLPPAGLPALQRAIGNAAVVRMLAQRHEREDPAAADEHPVQRSAVHDVLRSPGRPLDGATRADMEARLGADFSDVRIHTGPAAGRSAQEIGARAYTSGNHVVVGEGGRDRHTLAHELVHVVQQRSGPVAGTDNGAGLSVSHPSDRFEREAEQVATRVMSRPAGDHAAAPAAPSDAGAGAGHAVQRMMGFEAERDKRVKSQKGEKLPGDTDIAESKRADFKVVSDSRGLAGGGAYSNIEFVTGAVQVVGTKAQAGPDELDRIADEIRRVSDGFYAATEGTRLSALKLDLRLLTKGVTLSSEGYTESAGQPGMGDGLFVHYSIGVPLAGMPLFFDLYRADAQAREAQGKRTVLPDAQHRLNQARPFAAAEVARFSQATGSALDTTALDGYLQLVYTQVAAVADYVAVEQGEGDRFASPQGQIKNWTMFLSRSRLSDTFQLLDPEIRAYLAANHDDIIERLSAFHETTATGQQATFFDNAERALPGLDPVSLETYAQSALGAAPPVSQQQVFGGMNEIAPHGVEGANVIPMEIRLIGDSMKTWDGLKAELRKIAGWAQHSYQQDRQINAATQQ